jgi:hypothetical protein
MVFLDPQWLMRELIPLVNYLVDDHNLHHRAGIVELTELRDHYAHLPTSLFDHVPENMIKFELAIPLEEGQFFIPLRLQDWDETNTNDGKFVIRKQQKSIRYGLCSRWNDGAFLLPQRVGNTLIDPTIESKPVRLGKVAEDPDLWKFATSLQANPEK